MRSIPRDLKNKLLNLNKEYSCLLLTGARQVGKSYLFEMISRELGEHRTVVTLDDLEERALARRDPAMFLQIHSTPILIDEVQYAPELFSYIKIAIDRGAAPGAFWLTGSQVFRLMTLAEESLAGRAAILRLPSLSQHEIYGHLAETPYLPFDISLENLQQRKKEAEKANMREIYERIWNGSLPGLVSGKFTDRDVYYASYLETFLSRDVSEMIEGVDRLVFTDFIRAAACRIGEILNVHSIAADVGISDNTAKAWLQVLEKADIIYLLRPYSNSALNRTVKTPKMYFFDTGLVCYLTRYPSGEILQNGALAGAAFENYVVMEILKSYRNAARECLLWYYRDYDAKEIDVILESGQELHPIEIKKSVTPRPETARVFKALDKGNVPRGTGAIICMREELSAVDSRNLIIPAWYI